MGKLAPRRANQTDASFKVRSISLNQRKTLSSNETDDEAFKKKLSILKKPTTNLNSRKAIMSEILHDISTQRDGLSGHMDEILKVSALLIIDRSIRVLWFGCQSTTERFTPEYESWRTSLLAFRSQIDA